MKKKLNVNALRFLAVLAVVSLGGCGAGDGVPTLVWVQMGHLQPGFLEDQRVISDYVEEKIGVRLEFRLAGWADAHARFNTMINSGENFDILFVDPNTYNRFQSMGAFADLTDLLPEAAPGLLEAIPPILWEAVKIRGRIYSVPTYKDSSITGYYFWDHDFVQKYDIDLDRAGWPYLDEVFHRIKEGEGPRFHPYGLARGSNFWVFDYYDNMLTAFPPLGVRLDDTQRRVVLTLEQPDILEILRYIHSWYTAGIINSDANLISEEPHGRIFRKVQAWPSVSYITAAQEGFDRLDPVRFYGPYYSTASIQGSMNAISINSRRQREALALLELVNTDTTLRDMLAYGIEGKHFEYIDEGRAARTIQTGWSLVNYQQGNYFILTPQDTVPPGYWDEVRLQNETATPSVMMGFMMDMEPVMSELLNCRSVWDRHATDILTGAADPDTTLPRVIADLRTVGLDIVMAEAQRQVDAFFAGR